MKLYAKTWTGIILVLACGLAFGQSYTEDFEDGDVSDWHRFWAEEDTITAIDMSEAPSALSSGGLKVGRLQDADTSYTGYSQALMGNITDENYTVEADLYVYDNTGGVFSKYTGIVAYANPELNYYVKLVADFDADNRLRIYNNKVFSGSPWGHSIDATNLDKTEGWHHMKIKVTTDPADSTVAYQCWYDGEDLGTYVDTADGRSKSGYPGVFAGPYVAGYYDNFIVTPNNGTAIEDVARLPVSMTLKQNFPNPFNPATSIAFDIHQDGDVALRIFNIKGEVVKTLASGYIRPGRYNLSWDGTDAAGQKVAAGSYLLVLSNGNEQLSKNMLLVK